MHHIRVPLVALALLLQLGCEGGSKGSSKPSFKPSPETPAKEDAMTTPKPAKTVSPEVLSRFCGQPPGPAPTVVKVLKDSSGNIGGFSHRMLIVDSPISYLDSAGKPLALFHIFGSDEEKKKNGPIIDALLKAFPLEEDLPCPDPGKTPPP